MDGLTAAYIGKARFKAPEDALGGKRGFLKVMTDVPKLEFLTNFDTSKMMIETIYMKPYAACWPRSTRTAVTPRPKKPVK